MKHVRSKPPAWINKYKKDYEGGKITKEEIFKRENATRESSNKSLLQLKTVKRALNALGFSTDPFKSAERLRLRQEQKPPEVLPSPPTKPCSDCKYYTTKFICEYPRSMFEVYPELVDFDRDFAEGRCKLKER